MTRFESEKEIPQSVEVGNMIDELEKFVIGAIKVTRQQIEESKATDQ